MDETLKFGIVGERKLTCNLSKERLLTLNRDSNPKGAVYSKAGSSG